MGFGICAALTASAQVFKPVDSRKLADVSRQVIQPGELDLKTLPTDRYEIGEAPASKRRLRQPAIERKKTDGKRLELPYYPATLVPQQNFSAKHARESDQRATLPDGRPAAEVLPAQAAPIRGRMIDARTPRGEQELRDQLRKLRVPQDEK